MLLGDQGIATIVQIFKQSPHAAAASCQLAMKNREKAGVKFYTRPTCRDCLIL
jgi:hypothetical protein